MSAPDSACENHRKPKDHQNYRRIDCPLAEDFQDHGRNAIPESADHMAVSILADQKMKSVILPTLHQCGKGVKSRHGHEHHISRCVQIGTAKRTAAA